jgi:hypothetical protein
MKDGTPPAKAEPLSSAKDEFGNSKGGVRTPDVDVPISTLSGNASTLDILCSLFGTSAPFSSDKLAELYPTHEAYVAKVTDSARAAREAGFILPPEEQTFIDEANAAAVPR